MRAAGAAGVELGRPQPPPRLRVSRSAAPHGAHTDHGPGMSLLSFPSPSMCMPDGSRPDDDHRGGHDGRQVYAVDSYLSLLFKDYSVYFDLARDWCGHFHQEFYR